MTKPMTKAARSDSGFPGEALNEIERLNRENEKYAASNKVCRDDIRTLGESLEAVCVKHGIKGDGAYADGFDEEVARLRGRVVELEQMLRQESIDWAETDTHIRNAARPILGAFAVDGDSYGVPPVEDVVDGLVGRIKMLERLIALADRHVKSSPYKAAADHWIDAAHSAMTSADKAKASKY